MEREAIPEEEKCAFGSGPIVFSGTPPLMQGVVNLINKSAEEVKVRSIILDGAGLRSARARRLPVTKRSAPGEQALPEDLLKVKVIGRLAPFDQANVAALLNIDKFTPPGEYEAQVRIADQQARALVIVQENHDLRLLPNRLTITAAPGETIKRSIYIVNDGNVPFSTRRAAFAPLQALNMLHTSLAIALNEEGQKGHQKVLDRLASELSKFEVDPAKVKIEIPEEEIAPGETKCVEITVRLPAELKRRRTYTSRISFRKARLAVEVDVTGTPNNRKGRPQ